MKQFMKEYINVWRKGNLIDKCFLLSASFLGFGFISKMFRCSIDLIHNIKNVELSVIFEMVIFFCCFVCVVYLICFYSFIIDVEKK